MNNEPEIDFLLLFKTIWDSRLFLTKVLLISVLTGLVVSYAIPVKYTSSTLFVEQSADPKITLNEEKLSAITALAGIAGVELRKFSKGTMSPQTYTNLVASTPFQEAMLNSKIKEGITLKDYLQQTKTKQPISQLITVQILDDQFIRIQGTLNDPQTAAELTKNAREELINIITEIQTAKAKENLRQIQQRADEAQKQLTNLQNETKATKQSTQQRTSEQKIEINLAEATTLEINKKLEQAKTNLTEVTPLFKVIEEARIPTEKSAPNTKKLLGLFAFFGLAIAVAGIVGKGFIQDTKARWNKIK